MRHTKPTDQQRSTQADPTTHRPWPKGRDPERRSLFAPDLVMHLRLVLSLPPDEPAPGEQAACRGRPLPRVADAMDLGAWLGWCLAGLPLFVGKPWPSMEDALDTARRVVIGLAMERTGGNITRAAQRLGVARRTVRDCLRRLGMEGARPGSHAAPGPGPERAPSDTSDDGSS